MIVALAALVAGCQEIPRASLTVHRSSGSSERVGVGVSVRPGDALSLELVTRSGFVAAVVLQPSRLDPLPATGAFLPAPSGAFTFPERVVVSARPGMSRAFGIRCDAPSGIAGLAERAGRAVAAAGEPIAVSSLAPGDGCDEAFVSFEILAAFPDRR